MEAFSNTPYPASEYNIVAGVHKGVILARYLDGLAYKLPLNDSSKKHFIMTNFDYIWHDIKEIFDPNTVKGIFQYSHLLSTMIVVKLVLWAYGMGLTDSAFAPIVYFFEALIFMGMMELTLVEHHVFRSFIAARSSA